MNPYRPPLQSVAYSTHQEAESKDHCPRCDQKVNRVMRFDGLRLTICTNCKSRLRRRLPLWATLATVLAYLCGLLTYCLLWSTNPFFKAQGFWEIYLQAALQLILIPHLISHTLFRRYAFLASAADEPLLPLSNDPLAQNAANSVPVSMQPNV